jgi:hypothetical protein
MTANDFVPIISAGIGAVAALSGIAVKTLYDSRVEHRKLRREDASLFLAERRETYDRFLELHKKQVRRHDQLRKISLIVRDGGTPPSNEELAAFPESPMGDLAATLDAIRRLALSYEIVRAAEHMLRLHADLVTAQRRTLDAVAGDGERRELPSEAKQADDMLWFVLCNMLRDRELEFAYAYRADLGIGDPKGGPRRFPIEQRERLWPLDVSEHIVRQHVLPLHPPASCQRQQEGSKPDEGIPRRAPGTDIMTNTSSTDR